MDGERNSSCILNLESKLEFLIELPRFIELQSIQFDSSPGSHSGDAEAFEAQSGSLLLWRLAKL